MIKKIFYLLFLCLLFVKTATAKSGLNLYPYPQKVPQTEIFNQYGKKVNLENFKGNFVIIVFWSRYCAPCIKELDNLNNFSNLTKDKGIKVMIVSRLEEWKNIDELRKFLKRFKAEDIDFYLDSGSKLTNDFGINAYPHTVLLNKNAQEIGRIRGAVVWDDEDVIEYIYKIKAKSNRGLK